VISLTGVRDVTGDTDGRDGVTGLSPRTKKRTNNSASAVSEDAASQFETFWQVIPSRQPHPNPKKPAREKFFAAVKRGIDPAVIIRGAEAYAGYVVREATPPKFIKQAATWLNQELWTETYEPPEPRLIAGIC
jgi:hypothetical protein